MTDMRATERLLEVIEEGLVVLRDRNDVDDLIEAITELRRRGDTLVRREDLRLALEWANGYEQDWTDSAVDPTLDAFDRLGIALGGKP